MDAPRPAQGHPGERFIARIWFLELSVAIAQLHPNKCGEAGKVALTQSSLFMPRSRH
jgi:hypothetical protein